jgi:site-specific DNA-methyltransferase (adenine-specific)
MKPIEDFVGKVIQGDCLEVMKQMPDKSVDLVLTDPPYGLNFPYKSYDDSPENLQTLISDVMPEIIRISKIAAVSCGITNYHLYPAANWIISCSWNTTGSYGKFGVNQWFPVLLYGKDLAGFGSINGIIKGDVISVSGGGGVGFMRSENEKLHTCPKPLTIWSKLLIRLCNECDIILDPFLGSGTTAVAAERLGRKWIGIELEPKYCAIAQARVDSERAQLKMF